MNRAHIISQQGSDSLRTTPGFCYTLVKPQLTISPIFSFSDHMQRNSPAARVDSTEVLLRQILGSDSLQIATLRAEVAVLKETRADVLSLADTSIQVILGLAIVLIGYNWFASNRGYQRDKEALRQELATDLAKSAQENLKSVDAEISKQISALNEKVSAGITAETSQSVADTRQKLAAAVNEVRSLRSEIHSLRIGAKVTEAHYWEYRDVPGNEIDRWIELLDLCLSNNRVGHETLNALSNIARLGRAGTLPFWAEVPGLIKNLDSLPSEFQTEVAEIKTLLQKVPRG